MSQNTVRLESVSKSYGDVVALHEIDLAAKRGEFLTLLGPSGSGKTTILNLIAGMITPSSGKIIVDGKDVTETPPHRRGLGMVFQNYALMPHMNVFENVAFPLRVRRIPQAAVKEKVAAALSVVQLSHVGDRKPKELSGGQQQRISIARCLVYNPSIILMDEPLGALDKKLRNEMQIELRRLHKELGVTMIYVTHDQEEALSLSDRIVLMNEGRIEQIGNPAELYFQPCSIFSAEFIGNSNLLDAMVVECGHKTTVVTSAGDRIYAEPQPFATVGEKVAVMVRPERVRVSTDVSAGDGSFDNQVKGTVVDSIILGGTIRCHVAVDGNNRFVAQELVDSDFRFPDEEETVLLQWRSRDTLLLPPD